ncbi:MAG TPA: YdcF family protein, partial [Candidatus Paceibacterota bacterium]|nr:YdcF family protein [Candidatus Paceibacterota bacterium]
MDKKEVRKITNYVFLKSSPQKADLAFVFGTREQEATNKAYELYQNKYVNKILISGGINRITGENEAGVMSKKLLSLGVKKEDILLENRSTNSLENVLFSREVIDRELGFRNVKKVIAVVKHYHSRRALMTLKKHFPRTAELIPVTYEVYGFTKSDWFKSRKGKEKV